MSVTPATAARQGDAAALALALQASRADTLATFDAYCAALPGLRVPLRPELNPPLWELGHIGWFADWWIARNPQRERGTQANPDVPRKPSRQSARGIDAEALYHSSRVAHDSRWQLPLPGVQATLADLRASLSDTLAWLEQAPETDAGLYFFRLALAHEDMHAEAAVYMAQTLGFHPHDAHTMAQLDAPGPQQPARITVPAGTVTLGHEGAGFAFDNELGPQHTTVEAFTIDAHPLSWARFLPFVDSGGYTQRRFWTDAGWAWRENGSRRWPRYLRPGPGGWQQQRWGRWQPLESRAPVRPPTRA